MRLVGAEHIETLRKLWSEGLSAGQIVSHFGQIFTRSQVLGKLHRMGLLGLRNPKAKGPSKIAIKARPNKRTRRLVTRPLIPAHFPVGAAGRSFNDVCGPCYDITELRYNTCRWPLGDPAQEGFAYCAATTESPPYCPAHRQIAYVPPWAR